MTAQTSVSAKPTAASAGLVEHAYKDSMILSRVCDEALGISFGQACVRDGHDDKVDLPVSAAEVSGGTLGFAIRDSYAPYDADGYNNADPVPVLYEGVMWVLCEEAVTQGQPVYVRHTSDGSSNTVLGKVRNDAAPLLGVDTCTRLKGAVFLASTTAAGIALIHKSGVSAKGGEALVTVSTRIADVSTASSAYAVAPVAGDIVAIYTVLGGAISGADSVVTAAIAGVAITGISITVAQASSAAGDVDSDVPTALYTATAGQLLTATTDGASTGTATLDVFFVIRGNAP
jgi:hypothetical protein